MRSVTLVLALAAVCAAPPALGQARILIVQDQTLAPAQTPPPATEDHAPPPARRPASVLPPSPRLGPPPATVPGNPLEAQNRDTTPSAASPDSPRQTQVTPPPASAHPKVQEQVAAKPSAPESAPMPPVAGRYSFNRVDGGFLRLDKATGRIAYCSPHTAGWGCQAVPENQAELEKQVTRLRDEVASLKKLKDELAALKELQNDVAALKNLQAEVDSLKDLQDEVAALKKEVTALRPPPPRPPAPIPPPAATPGKDSTKLPGHQDLARAREYIAYTWHRLVDMINQFQKDMMGRREGERANGLSRT